MTAIDTSLLQSITRRRFLQRLRKMKTGIPKSLFALGSPFATPAEKITAEKWLLTLGRYSQAQVDAAKRR